jgi:hypothetical protein
MIDDHLMKDEGITGEALDSVGDGGVPHLQVRAMLRMPAPALIWL